MHNNTSNIDYITICDYNKIPKEKLKIVPKNHMIIQKYISYMQTTGNAILTLIAAKNFACVFHQKTSNMTKKIGTFGGTKSMVTAHHMILQLNFQQMISNTSEICIMNMRKIISKQLYYQYQK